MTDSEKFSKCPCTGKTLAKIVQPAVLAVLAEQPLHGYLIVQRLSEMMMFRGECPDPAGVYRVLRSMDRRGLVTSSWDLGKTGPAKRRFTLTPSGRACLKQWAQTLEHYARSIEDLLAMIREISREPHAAN
ncbi:MAG: helix-turn-helix transcriptional regulator [Sedimentisphaerales bacterium]|nr:helix-turn-helix transcriptional regulator [Sedimentisphaerales bacterium]